MNRFLSCDWGTSTLRMYLVGSKEGSLVVLAESTSITGMAMVYQEWKSTQDAIDRVAFFLQYLKPCIANIEKKSGGSVGGLPLIISGMASSTIGMMNLEYASLPFSMDGHNALTKILPATDSFPHNCLIISGLKTDKDLMRGEETQLVGCFHLNSAIDKEAIFIFPGTHSKQVYVKDGEVMDFATFMTGEMFQLLSEKSILHASVTAYTDVLRNQYLNSFCNGVQAANSGNFLQQLFQVRTQDVFQQYTKTENYCYLSGLCIGTELLALKRSNTAIVWLCAGASIAEAYQHAFHTLDIKKDLRVFSEDQVKMAVIFGQFTISNQQRFL